MPCATPGACFSYVSTMSMYLIRLHISIRKSAKGVRGAEQIIDSTDSNQIWQGFLSFSVAEQLYERFVTSNIPHLLKAHAPSPNERFIVVKGHQPGVYTTRRCLIIEGLRFGGGVVERILVNSTNPKVADDLFALREREGNIKYIDIYSFFNNPDAGC